MMIITALLYLQLLQLTTSTAPPNNRALLFKGNAAVVLLKPNMKELMNRFTSCAWVKTLSKTTAPVWLHYRTKEDGGTIYTYTTGYYEVLGSYIDVRSTLSPSQKLGSWDHHCLSWNNKTRTIAAYYNGNHLGNTTESSGRTIQPGGYLALGNHVQADGTPYSSGNYRLDGELYKFNMFNTELAHKDITAMYTAGRCSRIEEKQYNQHRYIRWEEVLKYYNTSLTTAGVSEVTINCPASEENDESQDQQDSPDTNTDDDTPDDDTADIDPEELCPDKPFSFLHDPLYYHKVLKNDSVMEILQRFQILEEFTDVNVTTKIIDHLNKHH